MASLNLFNKIKLLISKIINYSIDINLIDKIAGEGRHKAYDVIETTATRYFIPSKTLKDFFDKKYCIKRQIIQFVIVILIWIAPIKWLIELIVYKTYDNHSPAYYTSYFGMAFAQDDANITSNLAILVIFARNYYHAFCKSIK